MKKILLFAAAVAFCACANHDGRFNSLEQWKIGDNNVTASSFDISSGQKALYTGKVKGGTFTNFNFAARVTHSEGALARLWIHSNNELSTGYSILIGNPAADRRRTGSLESVRNLYKASSQAGRTFDLEVMVEGKRIVVLIDGMRVVDYLEPAQPYRLPGKATQFLSSGKIGFSVESGAINIAEARLMPLSGSLPAYPEGMAPNDELNDHVIRLQQAGFPFIDYHVHLKGLDKDEALENSLRVGIEYGIAPNCGIGFPITNDREVEEYLAENRHMPFFYGMQGEGREWPDTFSKATREMFDYVFTDAMTFLDHKGRRTRLWIDEEVIIDIPAEQYMDIIVDRAVKVLNEEPIDIYVNPTFLPSEMESEYDRFWTDARIDKIIKALKDNGIALEINARYRIPSAKIISAARDAGVKLTLGTNNAGVDDIGKLEYCAEIIEQCGLSPADMWFPAGQ